MKTERLGSPQLLAAMAFMQARHADTGGGCTAWELDHGDSYTLITVRDEPEAPCLLSQRCVVGFYDGDTGQLDQNRNDEEEVFPSVLEALRDLYGREEGSEWPAELADGILDAEARATLEWHGGCLCHPDDAAIERAIDGVIIATFDRQCFAEDGSWRPEILAAIIDTLNGMVDK